MITGILKCILSYHLYIDRIGSFRAVKKGLVAEALKAHKNDFWSPC